MPWDTKWVPLEFNRFLKMILSKYNTAVYTCDINSDIISANLIVCTDDVSSMAWYMDQLLGVGPLANKPLDFF